MTVGTVHFICVILDWRVFDEMEQCDLYNYIRVRGSNGLIRISIARDVKAI